MLIRHSFKALALFLAAALLLPLGTSPATAEGASITRIVVTQVLGTQSDRFVAGKDTVIRVYVNVPITVDAATQKLVVKRNGAAVTTLSPIPNAEPLLSLVFACPTRAACGDWAAGNYTFEASVGGTTATVNVVFKERFAISVLAVPVKANYGPGDVRSPDDSWKKQGEFTRRVYPLSPEGFKWHLGNELDASDIKFNLKTDDGMFELWKALAELQPVECRQKPKPTNMTCFDKVVGFVKDRQGAQGNLQGYTMGSPANIVTATDEDAQATVAHEIGHNYLLGDEYNGGQFNCEINPTPAEYVGKDFNQVAPGAFSCKIATVKAWPNGGTGTLVDAEIDLPYEIGGRGRLPDMTNFMGSGAKQSDNWVSAAAWRQMFDALDPAKAQIARILTSHPERYVSVAGSLSGAGAVTILPWYSYETTQQALDTTGAYTIRALNGAGAVLATSNLNVERTAPETIPGYNVRTFQTAVKFPAGTTRFEILQGTTVIKTVNASANAPTVTVTAPVAGTTAAGTFKITWNSNDADANTTLYHRVEYSPNNGTNWFTLEGDLEAKEWTEDFATLPGLTGAQALIKVTASDGVNSTSAVSAPFTVPVKAPIPAISFPETAYDEMTAGQEFWLEGGALDYVDDTVASPNLVWTSNLQGELGKGELLVVTNLIPGTHVITLTATNSQGVKATSTMTVAVFPAGRKINVNDVYALYMMYLGRFPTFGEETAPRIGHDFGSFIDELRYSEEAYLVQDVGFVTEAKSPYTGKPLPR